MERPVVIVVGTRPDAIKLLPIYAALKKQKIPTILCATNQHTHMLEQVLSLFGVVPDISCNVMVDGQSLTHVTASVLASLQKMLKDCSPALVMVQGDTATALAAALAAFFHKIPIAHIEAGLRTYHKESPFPEEINRTLIGKLADYHFAATPLNVAAVLRDGAVSDRVFCVGNTVIDAVRHVQEAHRNGSLQVSVEITQLLKVALKQGKKIVLVTTHRRESFGQGLRDILAAVKHLADTHSDYLFILPMHLNPFVRLAIDYAGVRNHPGIVCLEPLDYHEFILVLEAAAWVMTDSGGVQEEALFLGKKVLVLRDYTERVELLWQGMGVLSGTNFSDIIAASQRLMVDGVSVATPCYAYGDGHSANRIVSIVQHVLAR
jgi:UDP-N-acetylglucosamine 2-epimerase (non-hydrolysing)